MHLKRAALLIFLFSLSVLTQAQDFLVKEDLRLNWMYFDASQNILLPFLDDSRIEPVAIHQSLTGDFGKETLLLIDFPEESSLLINEIFIRTYENGKRAYFSLDSLNARLNGRPLNITLYKERGFTEPVNAKIGFLHTTFDASLNVNPINDRPQDQRQDYLEIIILSILTFFVILYVLFPADLFEFLSFNSLITFRYTDTAFTKYRSITKTQILVIVFEAAILAGIILIFTNYYYNPFGAVFFVRINLIFGWLIIFLLVALAIFLKYVLIGTVSLLFDISDKTNFYFIEYLRMSMMFYSFVFVVVSFMIINRIYALQSLLQVLVILIVAFNLIRLVVIYFKFRRTVSIKNLHLFSYLCTTELIPLIIGFKFFLK